MRYCSINSTYCENATINGYCSITACRNLNLLANISQEKEKHSNWHTEPPTEEDLKDIDEDNKYCFALCLYYDRWWLSDYLFKVNMEEKCFETATRDKDERPHRISFATSVVWKKIEPYKIEKK